MKKFFLTLALIMCWAVTAFAAGQINGLTLDNIEDTLDYHNRLNLGDWLPHVVEQKPTSTKFTLSKTVTFVAEYEYESEKIIKIQFFVKGDERITSKEGRLAQYINDISSSALTVAGLCIPKFDRDKNMVQQFQKTIGFENTALRDGKKCVFTAKGYQFTAVIIDGVYTIWAEKSSGHIVQHTGKAAFGPPFLRQFP